MIALLSTQSSMCCLFAILPRRFFPKIKCRLFTTTLVCRSNRNNRVHQSIVENGGPMADEEEAGVTWFRCLFLLLFFKMACWSFRRLFFFVAPLISQVRCIDLRSAMRCMRIGGPSVSAGNGSDISFSFWYTMKARLLWLSHKQTALASKTMPFCPQIDRLSQLPRMTLCRNEIACTRDSKWH